MILRIRYIILLITIFFCLKVNAQLIQWDWIIHPEGIQGDWGNGISLDNENNLLITGRYNGLISFGNSTLSNSGFNTAIFLTNIDSLGNFNWTISGTSDYFIWTNSTTTDNVNNIYLAGYYTLSLNIDSSFVLNEGNIDPFITKLNSTGDVIWVHSLTGTGEGFCRYILHKDNYLYISGGFEDTLIVPNISIISTGNDDVFFAKYDTSGNCIWLKNMVSSNEADAVKSMDLDSEGNIFMTGWFNNTAIFGDTSLSSFGGADGYIMKIDSSGTVLWVSQIGGASLDLGLSVCKDNFGNTFVKGIFNSTAVFGDTTLTAVNGMNFFITKLSYDGSFIWARRMLIECNINDDSYFNSITSDSDGNLYMTAWFALDFQFDGITLTSTGNYDSFVMKLSPEGDALWAMQLSSPGYVHSRSITNDNNGNLYITGWFNDVMTFGDSTISAYGGADVFIAKLHEEPVSVSYNEITETLEISVYPNPAKDYVNITNMEQQIEKAEIIGMNGAVIRTFNKSLNQLDVTGLRNGTYLLKLFDNNTIYVKKIVIN